MMWKRILKWLAFVGLGSLLLWALVQKALKTEEDYIRGVVLESSRDVAFLTARHAVDTLAQAKSQLEGLGRAILREEPEPERIHELLRIHFAHHPSVVGMRFYPNTTEPAEITFRNAASGLSTNLLLPEFAEQRVHGFLNQNGWSSFTQTVGGHSFAYIQFPVRDLRNRSYPGLLQMQVSMARLFEPAAELASRSEGEIVLMDSRAAVVLPLNQGYRFTPSEFQAMQAQGYGGMIRSGPANGELVSYCKLSLLGTRTLPDMLVLNIADTSLVEEFVHRMRLNLGFLMFTGVLLLMFLGRLIFLRS